MFCVFGGVLTKQIVDWFGFRGFRAFGALGFWGLCFGVWARLEVG